jgi:hypothetical protein
LSGRIVEDGRGRRSHPGSLRATQLIVAELKKRKYAAPSMV